MARTPADEQRARMETELKASVEKRLLVVQDATRKMEADHLDRVAVLERLMQREADERVQGDEQTRKDLEDGINVLRKASEREELAIERLQACVAVERAPASAAAKRLCFTVDLADACAALAQLRLRVTLPHDYPDAACELAAEHSADELRQYVIEQGSHPPAPFSGASSMGRLNLQLRRGRQVP